MGAAAAELTPLGAASTTRVLAGATCGVEATAATKDVTAGALDAAAVDGSARAANVTVRASVGRGAFFDADADGLLSDASRIVPVAFSFVAATPDVDSLCESPASVEEIDVTFLVFGIAELALESTGVEALGATSPEVAVCDLGGTDFRGASDVFVSEVSWTPEDETVEESARATPQPANIPIPIPSAMANPPTRPTYISALMILIPSTGQSRK